MNLFTFLRFDGLEISVPFRNIDAIAPGMREKAHGVLFTLGGQSFESKESYETLVERYNSHQPTVTN